MFEENKFVGRNRCMSVQKGDRMLHLVEVTEENWMQIASLSVSEEQKTFLAPAIGILARGYVNRS